MASNTYQPNGLSFIRNRISGANTYQANVKTIKSGYASNIGRGDWVKAGTGAYEGYIVLASEADTNSIGIFVSVLAYYDQTQQATAYGLVGSYQSGANPSGNISCLVIEDPFVTFMAQVSGGPFSQSWVGQNINIVSGTNGVPNISGQSTLGLDGSTVNVTPTLPFKIVGSLGITGGTQDPANTNPWIEVQLNTSQMLSPTGI